VGERPPATIRLKSASHREVPGAQAVAPSASCLRRGLWLEMFSFCS
jgi:hypothetical protein